MAAENGREDDDEFPTPVERYRVEHEGNHPFVQALANLTMKLAARTKKLEAIRDDWSALTAPLKPHHRLAVADILDEDAGDAIEAATVLRGER